MKIQAFQAVRPPPELARDVASLPYDVGELEDARVLAETNPRSFLHVERPEVDLPNDYDHASGIDHETAAKNLRLFLREGWLVKESEPALYVYRITLGEHRQTGVVACCHIEDYENNIIRKHEKTKKPVEDQRTRHVQVTGAHTGPIFLLFRDDASIAAMIDAAVRPAPLLDFTAIDGIRHEVWKIADADAWVTAFDGIPLAYVADGHHRTAAAARAGMERRAANPKHRGDEEYNWFPAVLFPASHLKVLAYNRTLKDLNGLTPEAFLNKTRNVFTVTEPAPEMPERPGEISMYLGGRWYGLTWASDPAADPVSALDVSVLQSRLLGPVLGIDDPRTNSRIEYAGGFDSIERIRKKVDAGRAAVAFSVYPTTVEQLMAIADADQIMPPKSTWFEPKLRSGLFVHELH
ncbi:MAG TPA: DUF1015 family protein [Kiritimatiellia bacterium]|nr:DUF1015 family protein [Kiritimatiellia bacterium]HMO97504.1 DUF1015 family protein [Kiritimatiellia bacterium]HMP98125.1 DUF1015 family protein [Kiritimatiellia bacterium]